MSGAAREGEILRRAQHHGVAGTLGIVHAGPLLAREVAAVSGEGRVVEGGFAIRDGRVHNHVSVGEDCHTEDGDGG